MLCMYICIYVYIYIYTYNIYIYIYIYGLLLGELLEDIRDPDDHAQVEQGVPE